MIRPLSLNDRQRKGDLPLEAFKRKQKRLSVDDKGLIGSLLDGRWKPPPVVDQEWFRSKSELYYITTLLSHAVACGDRPPFKSLQSEFSNLRRVKIDPNSFEIRENNEVIFKARVHTDKPNEWVTIWGRAVVMIPFKKRMSLEERLKEILKEARKKGIKIEKKDSLILKKVSRDTIAVFSTDRSIITAVRLSG